MLCITPCAQSKQEWARALRVLTHHNHLPALVHCVHGKDRTGLLVMLVALLCGVDPEVRRPGRGHRADGAQQGSVADVAAGGLPEQPPVGRSNGRAPCYAHPPCPLHYSQTELVTVDMQLWQANWTVQVEGVQ